VPRLLAVDENLNKRIAAELKRRGRNARSIAELKLRGKKDPELLEALLALDPDCVLITGDDAMPATHAEDLARLRPTIAIVLPWDPNSSLEEPEWEHEIVQKWAHLVEAQPSGTVYRYSPSGRRKWTKRRRPPRLV